MAQTSPKKAQRKLKHKGHQEEESPQSETEDAAPDGYCYFQMELPVQDITPEFEAEVTRRISTQVKIVPAKTTDCERLIYLHNRAFLTATDPYSPISYEDMMRVLTFRDNIVLIGTIWGEDAGFIILGFDYYPSLDPDWSGTDMPEEASTPLERDGKLVYNVGYISGLGVDPRWQGRGVGTTLGVTSWKYFKAANLKKLKCEVYEKNNASYNLISSLGFKKITTKTYSVEQSRTEQLRRL
jgi:ribosomal protein S18 acetylase RimI-like enzyme